MNPFLTISAQQQQASGDSLASSLLFRLKSNDAGGWRELQFLYGPVLANWLRRAGVPEADAADLQQEILRRVAQHVADFRRSGNGNTFRGWLWTITHNVVRDRIRRLKRTPQAEGGTDAWLRLASVPFPDDESSIAPPCEQEELLGLLGRATELVKQDVQPHTWEAFWLTTVDGLTAAEAAEKLAVAVGTVYTARSRVLSRLRQVMGDDCVQLLGWT